jgi:hypothetical protein
VNKDDKVMPEYLTEHFVDHNNIGLAPQTIAELSQVVNPDESTSKSVSTDLTETGQTGRSLLF